jgi:septum site-determining protein MinC
MSPPGVRDAWPPIVNFDATTVSRRRAEPRRGLNRGKGRHRQTDHRWRQVEGERVTGTEHVSDRDAPFQLRGGSFTLMVLKLLDPTSDQLFARLGDKVRQAPNFFRNAPVVLDLDGLASAEPCDFADLKSRLGEYGLVAIGVQGGSRPLQEAALRTGLPLVPTGRPSRPTVQASSPAAVRRVAAATPAPVVEPAATGRPAMVVNEPVRGGRQIYAPGGDLVVTAMVSAGAELLADGHIHVYGALRGRALAGISGDTSARIFCLSLEAEMVSIAGLYRVNEDIAPSIYRKQVQVFLKEGYLCLEPF